MYLLNGKKLHPGHEFVVGEGDEAIQYGSTWLALSTGEDRAAIGIVDVPEPVRPDDRLYFVNENVDGTYTTIPRDPEQLLASAQATQIKIIEDAYDLAIQQPVDYLSTTFQADKDSRDLVVASLSAGAVPAGFFWLDANNVQVPMTYAQLQGMAGAMLTQGQMAFVKKTSLKAQIRAATTTAAVALVTW